LEGLYLEEIPGRYRNPSRGDIRVQKPPKLKALQAVGKPDMQMAASFVIPLVLRQRRREATPGNVVILWPTKQHATGKGSALSSLEQRP
jgi:hypothetical protein